jgi:hypothetical protein
MPDSVDSTRNVVETVESVLGTYSLAAEKKTLCQQDPHCAIRREADPKAALLEEISSRFPSI